jgi:hypothetical protein
MVFALSCNFTINHYFLDMVVYTIKYIQNKKRLKYTIINRTNIQTII